MADHTLILDIGKSNAKLMLIDADGEVRARSSHANASVDAAVEGIGYRALGVAALQQWLLDAIPALPQRERIGRIGISTHGAAFCAIDDEGLVLPPIDYEWDGGATGYGDHRDAFAQAIDPFAHTGAPLLPLGLNGGLPLFWLQRVAPASWARIRHWLPYPQYWAWWLSGVAASEVSSLGCHTQLWSPAQGTWSDWAQRSGIAARFAPLRGASDVLGVLRPALARQLGLRADCEVVCGVHDSNACLARYLDQPAATLLTTGTWTVAMATGSAPQTALRPERDELINVSVTGQPVPTARFMGGREFEVICAGAPAALATEAELAEVMAAGWHAQPGFADAGGPFQGQVGQLLRHGVAQAVMASDLPRRWRPALASLYCAQVSAGLVDAVRGVQARGAVILEGPLAHNPAYGAALAALLGAQRPLWRSSDALEGTARGAWLLSRRPVPTPHAQALTASDTSPGAAVQLARIAAPPAALANAVRAHTAAGPLRRADVS